MKCKFSKLIMGALLALCGNHLQAFDISDDRSVGTLDGAGSMEVTPSSSPKVGSSSHSPEALKLMQKLCGRYQGPLSPTPESDISESARQLDFVTRDGSTVKLNLSRRIGH